jgi:anti-anti-sigma regulatory factor
MADPTTVDRLLTGDHVCWTFDDHERHLRALVRFVRKGLERREQVLYYTDTFLPAAFLAAAQAYGVEISGPLASGQLHVTGAQASFLAGGDFDPGRALKGWEAAIERARSAGYRGLRVAADMGWTVRPAVDLNLLVRYEAQANRILSGAHAIALCCYDRRLFTRAELERISAAHPGAARAGAGSQEEWEPLLRMRRTPAGLTLHGAADRTNTDALAAVVEPLVAEARRSARPLVIDVSGLAFADVATARLLSGAVGAAGGRLLLRGARPSVAGLLTLTDHDPDSSRDPDSASYGGGRS